MSEGRPGGGLFRVQLFLFVFESENGRFVASFFLVLGATQLFRPAERSYWLEWPNMAAPDWLPQMALFLGVYDAQRGKKKHFKSWNMCSAEHREYVKEPYQNIPFVFNFRGFFRLILNPEMIVFRSATTEKLSNDLRSLHTDVNKVIFYVKWLDPKGNPLYTM